MTIEYIEIIKPRISDMTGWLKYSDGKGITYCYKYVLSGNMVSLDDGLVLWFLKSLS